MTSCPPFLPPSSVVRRSYGHELNVCTGSANEGSYKLGTYLAHSKMLVVGVGSASPAQCHSRINHCSPIFPAVHEPPPMVMDKTGNREGHRPNINPPG